MPFLVRSSLALVAAFTFVACAQRPHVHAALPPPSSQPPGVSVTGIGEATGAPDVARAKVGVEARAETAERAHQEASTRSAAVLASLRQTGVADKDVKTSNVSLDFERVYEPPQPLPVPAAPVARAAPSAGGKAAETTAAVPAPALPRGFYRATQAFEVTVRRLERVGQILGAAAAAGADQMSGVEFRIEDSGPLEAVARQKAMADARARAERLAQLAGLRLGRALSISESVQSSPPPPMPMLMRAEAASVQNVPIAQGELEVIVSVQLVYELLESGATPPAP